MLCAGAVLVARTLQCEHIPVTADSTESKSLLKTEDVRKKVKGRLFMLITDVVRINRILTAYHVIALADLQAQDISLKNIVKFLKLTRKKKSLKKGNGMDHCK
jgi:hypothetical protein